MAEKIEAYVTIEGVTQATEISEETRDIIETAADMWDTPEVWFLLETVKKYGLLTEENILRFIYWHEEEVEP